VTLRVSIVLFRTEGDISDVLLPVWETDEIDRACGDVPEFDFFVLTVDGVAADWTKDAGHLQPEADLAKAIEKIQKGLSCR
jgi:hypothetical protein